MVGGWGLILTRLEGCFLVRGFKTFAILITLRALREFRMPVTGEHHSPRFFLSSWVPGFAG